MKNTLLTEDEAPITLHTITSNHCNGYGDYNNYVNTYLGGNSLLGMYGGQTLTFSATLYDNGNSTPQVGDYHWFRGIVWKISHVGPDDGNSVGISGGLHPANVGNGEWCTTHWKCNIKPHLNCKKQAMSSRPHAPGTGGANWLPVGHTTHTYGNKEACLHNCRDNEVISNDGPTKGTPGTNEPTTPTETTSCTSNISGINCLKPLIVPPVNVSQPVTQGGCCMVKFSFSNSPKPTFTIQGCKDPVSGNMGYEVSNNGSPLISSTNNGGSVMSFNPIVSGDYTGKVNCDNTHGADTRNICLKEDPNDPMVSDQSGSYVSGGFLEGPCKQSSPTSPSGGGQLSEEIKRIWKLNQIL